MQVIISGHPLIYIVYITYKHTYIFCFRSYTDLKGYSLFSAQVSAFGGIQGTFLRLKQGHVCMEYVLRLLAIFSALFLVLPMYCAKVIFQNIPFGGSKNKKKRNFAVALPWCNTINQILLEVHTKFFPSVKNSPFYIQPVFTVISHMNTGVT